MQSVQESIPQFVLKILLTSFIYLKLSLFQRHHAQHRVFPEFHATFEEPSAPNDNQVKEPEVLCA
jgi:hypothetical protein